MMGQAAESTTVTRLTDRPSRQLLERNLPSHDSGPPAPVVPLTRTVQLEREAALAPNLHHRVAALIRLALWCADAERSRAWHVANEAVIRAGVLDDRLLFLKARYARAVAAVFVRDHPETIVDYYHELLRLGVEFDVMGHPVDSAWCDLIAGIALELLGDPGGTVLLLDRALTTFRRFGDLGGQARCLNTLAVAETLAGRHSEALPLFRRSADLAAHARRPGTHALAWLNAAEACTELGRSARADGRTEEAARLFSQAHDELEPLRRRLSGLGYRQLQPHLAGLRAITMLHLGQHVEAVAAGERALELAAITQSKETVGTAHCYVGDVRMACGDLAVARELYQTALADCGQWIRTADHARALRGLVEVSETMGELSDALGYHKQLLDIELLIREQTAQREREVAKARLQLAVARHELHEDEDARVRVAQLLRENQALVAEREVFEQLAHTDTITGLANRRRFEAQAARMAVRAELAQRPLSLIIVDIDRFKQINDSYGHAAGDEILRRVATTLQRRRRKGDVVARVGGEEFALLLGGMELPAAIIAAEELRMAVRECDVGDICAEQPVTISVGVSVFRAGIAVDDVYAAADSALYQAKETGRNRVCVAQARAVSYSL